MPLIAELGSRSMSYQPSVICEVDSRRGRCLLAQQTDAVLYLPFTRT